LHVSRCAAVSENREWCSDHARAHQTVADARLIVASAF
jgi:hypothetical protein